jgi:hypothetical protein
VVVTDAQALAAAFARAGGTCECIGGGCPSLSHRPGINRCSTPLHAVHTTSFFSISRFADRSDPENITAVCAACAESPRRQGQRIAAPAAAAGSADDAQGEGIA